MGFLKRFHKTMIAGAFALGLAGTMPAYGIRPPVDVEDPCAGTSGCEPHTPPQDPGQPPTDPGQGGNPGTPGPGPAGPAADLFPAMLMNFEDLPNNQIHTEGWWDCADLNEPGEEHPEWCPQIPPGPRQRGAWHKYYVRTMDLRRSNCDAEIVFTKSLFGGGMEIHCAYGDRIAIMEEELGWDRTSKWRNFWDDLERPGSIWVRRNVPQGQFFAEGGRQQYHTCSDLEAVVAQYPLSNMWAIKGPYAIDTPEGLAAAQEAFAAFTPPGYPAVEPAWIDMRRQVPGASPSDHMYIWLRYDGWALRNGYNAESAARNGDLNAWWMTEGYTYGAVGASPDAIMRGLGMIAWRARENLGNGNFRFIRQVVFDTVVQEGTPRMQYGVCKEQSTSSNMIATPNGLVLGEDPASSGVPQVEKRAQKAYSWGGLPWEPIPAPERERVERRYREIERWHNQH